MKVGSPCECSVAVNDSNTSKTEHSRGGWTCRAAAASVTRTAAAALQDTIIASVTGAITTANAARSGITAPAILTITDIARKRSDLPSPREKSTCRGWRKSGTYWSVGSGFSAKNWRNFKRGIGRRARQHAPCGPTRRCVRLGGSLLGSTAGLDTPCTDVLEQ